MAEGVPRAGVTSVGDVAKTAAPEPVSSVKAVDSWADVKEPRTAALPTEVTWPVRLALVVTLPEVKPAAVPVMFVPTKAEGVPRAGVTSVGDVANTKEPEPVSSVIAAARFAELGVPRSVATPVASPDTPVEMGSPVAFVRTPAEGVPRLGVTRTGLIRSALELTAVCIAVNSVSISEPLTTFDGLPDVRLSFAVKFVAFV
jgi:hypothetical protein